MEHSIRDRLVAWSAHDLLAIPTWHAPPAALASSSAVLPEPLLATSPVASRRSPRIAVLNPEAETPLPCGTLRKAVPVPVSAPQWTIHRSLRDAWSPITRAPGRTGVTARRASGDPC